MEESHSIVTVVVPCYNNGKTIKETIESVLCQTSSCWELICVDDGSTDGTVEIIKGYCEQDSRIKLMIRDCPPKGGSHCRNIGGFAAKGDYLIFLDGDDLLAPTCLEKRVNSIENTKYNFVVFPMARFTGNDINNAIPGTKLYKRRNYLYYFASGNAGWQITSPIIRTAFFRNLGGFDTKFQRLQDIEYNLRAIAKAGVGNYHVMFNASCDCYYRRSTNVGINKIQKNKKGLEAYSLFKNLVLSLNSENIFSDTDIVSIFLLNIYCNAYIQYDYLMSKRAMVEFPMWLKELPNEYAPSIKYIILYRILFSTSHYYRVNYWLARIIGKILRYKYIK